MKREGSQRNPNNLSEEKKTKLFNNSLGHISLTNRNIIIFNKKFFFLPLLFFLTFISGIKSLKLVKRTYEPMKFEEKTGETTFSSILFLS